MINKIRVFFQNIGLVQLDKKTDTGNTLQKYESPNKTNESKDIAKNHLLFLEKLKNEEDNRMQVIENKSSQIMAQTSIIFSLLSLLVPLIFDKTNDVNILFKLLFILTLAINFLFYLLAIHNALKNLKVNNFRYASTSKETVLEFNNKSLLEFNVELINDHLYCLKVNTAINDKKATNLIHSQISFKFANIFLAINILFICILMLINKKEEPKKIELTNPIEFVVPRNYQ